MVFRRRAEAFTSIQSKTLLLCWTILYVMAMASWIILELNVKNMTFKDKNGEKVASYPDLQQLLLKGPIAFCIRGLDSNHATVSKLQELYWHGCLVVALSTDCVSCLPAKPYRL
jgi:hypothetical protein